MVGRKFWELDVAGSNPVTPTNTEYFKPCLVAWLFVLKLFLSSATMQEKFLIKGAELWTIRIGKFLNNS